MEEALTISRIGHSRRRPIAKVFGKCGAITCHCASVRLLWYSVTGRLFCCRVVGVHMAKSKIGSRNLLESRRAPMTQPFSKTAADKGAGD